MKIRKLMALLLAALLCATGLSACKNESDFDGEIMTLAPLDALDVDKLGDYSADSETMKTLEKYKNTFSTMTESPRTLFELTERNGAWQITKYVGNVQFLRIPAEIDGKPVTSIADGAFRSDKVDKDGNIVKNETLLALYIPDSVTSIGTKVFEHCTALESLRTPLMGADSATAQYLGYLFGASNYVDNARDVPASLKHLELGGNYTELPAHALFDCNDLIYVAFPETLKSIGTYAMYNCKSLVALDVRNLTALAPHALDACRGLTKLTFGESLTSIGIGALEACDSLRTLTLPFVGGSATENTYLGYIFGATVPDFSAGYYPQYLTRVTLLPTCTSIGNYAFHECDMLTEVVLPETLIAIGTRAFSGCLYLSKINFPAALTTVGDSAFFGCRSLTEIDLGQTALTRVGINAFYYCDALTAVTLPTTLTSLPSSCFAGCTKLETINLEGISEIGTNAFRGCPKITVGE